MEPGKQDQAVEFLKEAFAEAVHVESGGKDKALLQREFIQLGQLLDEEFTVEIASRTLLNSVASPPSMASDSLTKQTGSV